MPNEDIILAKLESIGERQSDIKLDIISIHDDVGRLDDRMGRFDDRISDLSKTVINHINSDIQATTKKSITNTPHWLILLLVFFLGRVSIELVDAYQHTTEPSQTSIVRQASAKPTPSAINTTYVIKAEVTPSLNKKIDKKIMQKLGLDD